MARSIIGRSKFFIRALEKKVCRQRLVRFLDDQEFACSISTGFAGALNDDLQIGDLLLAENFSTIDLSETRASLSGLPIHIANLLTVPALIDSREKRNKLALTSGAVAADMETQFIARTCAARGIPLLSLRVISDTPRDLFPSFGQMCLFDIERQRTPHAEAGKIFSYASESRSASDPVREENCIRTKGFSGCAGRCRGKAVAGSLTPAAAPPIAATVVPARYERARRQCVSRFAGLRSLLDARSRGLRARKSCHPLRREDRHKNPGPSCERGIFQLR